MPRELHCLVCDKEIELEDTGTEHTTPLDAVACHTYGNYGSRVFDPGQRSEYLEFYACDECLKKKAERIFYSLRLRENTILISFAEYLKDQVSAWNKMIAKIKS